LAGIERSHICRNLIVRPRYVPRATLVDHTWSQSGFGASRPPTSLRRVVLERRAPELRTLNPTTFCAKFPVTWSTRVAGGRSHDATFWYFGELMSLSLPYRDVMVICLSSALLFRPCGAPDAKRFAEREGFEPSVGF
jgi:hypothetical protein